MGHNMKTSRLLTGFSRLLPRLASLALIQSPKRPCKTDQSGLLSPDNDACHPHPPFYKQTAPSPGLAFRPLYLCCPTPAWRRKGLRSAHPRAREAREHSSPSGSSCPSPTTRRKYWKTFLGKSAGRRAAPTGASPPDSQDYDCKVPSEVRERSTQAHRCLGQTEASGQFQGRREPLGHL